MESLQSYSLSSVYSLENSNCSGSVAVKAMPYVVGVGPGTVLDQRLPGLGGTR